MRYLPRVKLSFLARFSLVSFLLTVTIAISLAWVIQRQLEQNALHIEAEIAADQVATILTPNLYLADLNGPLDPARYEQLDALIRQYILQEHSARVKLWNQDGLLLYSDVQDLVGRRFPITDNLQQALSGEISMEVSSLEEEENIAERERYGQLLEVYVPLQPVDSPEVAGAYEIYRDMAILQPRIAAMRRSVWATVSLGFLILYGSLFTLVRSASRQLVRRNEENFRLYKQARQQLAERMQAETALRESEERFRGLAQTATDAIITIGADRYVKFFNRAAEHIFGYSSEEMVGQSVDILVPEEYRARHEAAILRYLETGQPSVMGLTVELKGLRKEGRIFPLELALSEVRVGGEVTFTAIIRDITERVQAEEQIKRQMQRISALHHIDLAITASLDLRLTLNVLLDQVTTQLGVDAAAVLLLNPHTQTLDYTSGRGFRTAALQHTHLRLGEGHAGRAALERRTLNVPNLAEDMEDLTRAPLLAREGFVTYYAAPLVARGQVQGALEIFHRAPFDPSVGSGQDPDPEWLEFLNTLAAQAAIAIDNATLFDNLQRSNVELAVAYDATLEGWSRAMDLRDEETEGHTQRVTEMTLRLARAIGMSDEQLVHVRRGALLHDMGKMGIPDRILLKTGPLTEEEWEVMRKHPAYAYEMFSPIAYLQPALDIPYCHHEKWDGSGYPRGLKGEAIPLAARVFAVADVWDALRSDRPYRKAWPEEKVRKHIRAGSGTHFDSQIVEAFLALVADGG